MPDEHEANLSFSIVITNRRHRFIEWSIKISQTNSSFGRLFWSTIQCSPIERDSFVAITQEDNFPCHDAQLTKWEHVSCAFPTNFIFNMFGDRRCWRMGDTFSNYVHLMWCRMPEQDSAYECLWLNRLRAHEHIMWTRTTVWNSSVFGLPFENKNRNFTDSQ